MVQIQNPEILFERYSGITSLPSFKTTPPRQHLNTSQKDWIEALRNGEKINQASWLLLLSLFFTLKTVIIST